jgi:hypothetical protein
MVRCRTLLAEVMLYLTLHAEWVKVPFLETIQRVICRTTNRIFVGVPLCTRSSSHSSTPLVALTVFTFFSGRDRDYQNLNLTYSINVMKFGIIISWFPKPLKLCVVPLHVFLFQLNPTLALFHAYYRIFPPRFNKKLNSLDLWYRSDLRRWRSMGRTGMINRFVGPLHLVSRLLQLHDRSTERYAHVAHD